MDDLVSRLKKLASERDQSERAELSVQQFAEKVNAYISDHAREEFERFRQLLADKIALVNPQLGDLPPYEYQPGALMAIQGNCVAGILFDKPIINAPTNALVISFAPNPRNMYFFSRPPSPIRYRLQAAVEDDFSKIVWTGDLGELTSEQLCDFLLENLTEYYLENKPAER